jgi:hypothetical protein
MSMTWWLRSLPSTVSGRCASPVRGTVSGAKVRVNVDLQDDLSMDQTLSLYLLENLELILRKQLDRIKDRAVAQMKADGIDYAQRMEELEKLEYPKPLRDFVYETFNAFADERGIAATSEGIQ